MNQSGRLTIRIFLLVGLMLGIPTSAFGQQSIAPSDQFTAPAPVMTFLDMSTQVRVSRGQGAGLGSDLGPRTSGHHSHSIRASHFVATASSFGPELESVHPSPTGPRIHAYCAVPASQCAGHADDYVSKIRGARDHADGSGPGQRQRAASKIHGSTAQFASWRGPDGEQYHSGIGHGRGSFSNQRPISHTID
jgi:hypothetical protein